MAINVLAQGCLCYQIYVIVVWNLLLFIHQIFYYYKKSLLFIGEIWCCFSRLVCMLLMVFCESLYNLVGDGHGTTRG